MTPGSIRLGTYAGIPVRAHWSMAIVAVWFGVAAVAPTSASSAASSPRSAFFASILAHEFGHALVARRYGVRTESIDLWALGGVARLDRESPTPRADGLIAVAGPAVSLLIGVGRVRRRALALAVATCCAGSASSTASWRCSTCCPGARSTAAGCCGPFGGHARATSTGPMRDAGNAGRRPRLGHGRRRRRA